MLEIEMKSMKSGIEMGCGVQWRSGEGGEK